MSEEIYGLWDWVFTTPKPGVAGILGWEQDEINLNGETTSLLSFPIVIARSIQII